MGSALIISLSKKDRDPEQMASYSPLSRLNVDYKILSKILVDRLPPYMRQLVHSDQSGFIPRHSIIINICKLLHVIDCHESLLKDAMIMAIEIEKAFDSLDLYITLGKMGFGQEFVK